MRRASPLAIGMGGLLLLVVVAVLGLLDPPGDSRQDDGPRTVPGPLPSRTEGAGPGLSGTDGRGAADVIRIPSAATAPELESAVVTFVWPTGSCAVDPAHVFTHSSSQDPGEERVEVPVSDSPSVLSLRRSDRWAMELAGRRVADGIADGTAIVFDLARCPVLRGRITAPDGTPIPDVSLDLVLHGWESEPRLISRTGRDGAFLLAALPGDVEITLSAHKDGWTESRAPGLVADSLDRAVPLELVLEPAGCLTGVVVDPAGRPVEGLPLQLLPQRGPGQRQVTAPDGGFTFSEIVGWPVLLAGRDAAGSVETRLESPPAQPIRLERREWARIAGRVVWDDGLPVGGAELTLLPTTRSGSEAVALELSRTVLTSEDGSFEGPADPVGVTRVRARGRTSTLFAFAPGEFADIVLPRNRPWRIHLRPTGEPSADATLRMLGESWSVVLSPSVVERHQLTFETKVPFTERVKLIFRSPGVSASLLHDGLAGDVHEALLDIPTDDRRRVDVTVTDDVGSPLEGAWVRIQWPADLDVHAVYELDRSSPFVGRPAASTVGRTQSSGLAALLVPTDGPGSLSVHAPGFRPYRRALDTLPIGDVVVALEPVATP